MPHGALTNGWNNQFPEQLQVFKLLVLGKIKDGVIDKDYLNMI
jgi:hypothetical protein